MKNVWQWIVKPPHHGVPWLVWIYIVLSYVLFPNGGVFTGHLLGWDDHVRMTQVLDWVNGAKWYDRTITRVNAPEGFTTIWSRIVDIPLAAVIIIAQNFVAQKTAALIAAALIPIIQLILVFRAAAYFVRPLVGKKKANLIPLFLLFTSIANPALESFTNAGFYIGQASHHSWYIILVLYLFGATARLAIGTPDKSPEVIMALSMTLLLLVGIEGFPMIAAAAALLACVSWANKQAIIAKRGALCFFASALSTLILVPMHQPLAHWLVISFAEPSILGPILLAVAAIFLFLHSKILDVIFKNKIETGLISLSLALLIFTSLILVFPQMRDGAAAGLSPAERHMALTEHLEALPVYKVAIDRTHLFSLLFPSLIALISGIYAFIRAPTKRRQTIALCYMGFAGVGLTTEMLFSRYCHHALTTGCAWLLWTWEQLKKHFNHDINYALKSLISYLILGPINMFGLIIFTSHIPLTSNLFFFPSLGQNAIDPCDPLSLSNYINQHFAAETNLIVPYWLSSEFLYYSNVKIDFLANYPSQNKFMDSYAFWRAPSENQAHEIARRHKVDLVAVCKFPSFYNPNLPFDSQLFLPQLQSGKPIEWLRPVALDITTNYILYEIDHSKL